MKQLRKTVCYCMYLIFFGILAGRCGSVVIRERDLNTKGPGARSRFDPGLRFFFFLIESLSITGQKLKMAATVYAVVAARTA